MILSKDNLGRFLERLAADAALYAPVADDGVVLFRRVAGLDGVALDARNSAMSPKGVVVPQTQRMFDFHVGKDDATIAPQAEPESRVIFGIRPCDTRGLQTMGDVFATGYDDVYFTENRARTTLVAIACTVPGVNCFCTSVGIGPAYRDGADLLFTDLGDRYYVDVVSERGRALLGDEAEAASADDTAAAQAAHDRAAAAMTRRLDTEGVQPKVAAAFEHPYWADVAQRCLGCGICTFVCPTCYCFDIQDEIRISGDGRRQRIWDACMFPEYTLETSGHNPRPVRAARLRNRVQHKFNYAVQNFGRLECTGCGRCIENCPVNIDIIEMVESVVKP